MSQNKELSTITAEETSTVYLNAGDAAKYIGVSAATFLRMVLAEQLPYTLFNKRKKI